MERAAAPAAEGDWVGGYRIVRPLGARAEGRAYLAHDPVLDRPVVVRFVEAERLGVARELARLGHPALPHVHRIVEVGQRPYVISEYVRGERLAGARLAPIQAERMVGAVTSAIRAMHAVGVAHGDLCAERVILGANGEARLLVSAARALDDTARAADLDALATVVTALGRDRSASTHADVRSAPRPPYQGLLPYEADDHAELFGRGRIVATLLELLATEPLVLLVGRSGSGKSSVLGAGVQAAVAAGALPECARWQIVTIVPTRRPLLALAAAMARAPNRSDSDVLPALRTGEDPTARRRATNALEPSGCGGMLLCVDQLEEIFTLSSPEEREQFFATLARLSEPRVGVRVVAAIRSDFLPRLADASAEGRGLLRSAVHLPPLAPDEIRHAILAPAAARGVHFESEAMVAALVDVAAAERGGLPILSFVLAELWGARDVARGVIPASALAAMGGPIGALARHADQVIASLQAASRAEARRILVELVATDGARRRAGRAELVSAGAQVAEQALDALVRGRLVVAGHAEDTAAIDRARPASATYELADDALARHWPTLARWSDEATLERAAAREVATSAERWERDGRPVRELWAESRLKSLPASLPDVGAVAVAFLRESRSRVRRARWRRLGPLLGVPLVLAATGVVAHLRNERAHRARVHSAIAAASDRAREAAHVDAEAVDLRRKATELFDANSSGAAEATWKASLDAEERAEVVRRSTEELVDTALALNPEAAEARAIERRILESRLASAHRRHLRSVAESLEARLGSTDAATSIAQVHVRTEPAAARLTLSRYVEREQRLMATDPRTAEPEMRLVPGSYLLEGELPGHWPTRFPFVVRGGAELTLRVVLPRAESVPTGMIYIPEGNFAFGSDDDEVIRGMLGHVPQHEVTSSAYLIGRTEVTWGDYLDYLHSLPEAERRERMPVGASWSSGAPLRLLISGRQLQESDAYCVPDQPCVSIRRLPVDGVSRNDGRAYAAWLSATGRISHARLCSDREWERAARGADGRRFPWGRAKPMPETACTLAKYRGDGMRAGFCAVATHPLSTSPFGVDDLVGNVWEWTRDDISPSEGILRGGSYWNDDMSIWVSNRLGRAVSAKVPNYGIRICAPAVDRQ